MQMSDEAEDERRENVFIDVLEKEKKLSFCLTVSCRLVSLAVVEVGAFIVSAVWAAVAGCSELAVHVVGGSEAQAAVNANAVV